MSDQATQSTYTIAQLKDRWHCSDDQIRLLIRDEQLHAINVGSGKQKARWIITAEAVQEFEAKRSNRKAAPKRRARPAKPQRDWV